MDAGWGHVEGEGLKDLEEEITCPLCLDIFEDPKILSCHHIYCKVPCLEGLALSSGSETISCPECRKVTRVPGNDVGRLPPAFQTNRLKEVFTRMQSFQSQRSKDSGVRGATPSGTEDVDVDFGHQDDVDGKGKCRYHPSERLALFCSTCQELVCRDCIILDRSHETHGYDPVEKVAADYRKSVLDKLRQVQQMKRTISQALSSVMHVRKTIEEQGTSNADKINSSFGAIAATVENQKLALLQKVKGITDSKLEEVTAQVEMLQGACSQMDSLMVSIQDATSYISDEEFLSRQQRMQLRIKELTTKIKSLSLVPVTFPDVQVQVVSPDQVANLCAEESTVYKLVDPTRCHAEGIPSVAEVGKMFHLEIHLADSSGNPTSSGEPVVKAELKGLRFGTVAKSPVQSHSPSCYEVLCRPESHMRGWCELSLKVNGTPLPNSPFTVKVMCSPTQLRSPVKTIDNVTTPRGLAISSNGMLLVAHGNEVAMYDSDLDKILGITQSSYAWEPWEMTTDSYSNIYITDGTNHYLHKFTKDGVRLKSVGGPGSKVGTFNCPNGVEFSKEGTLFVCDSYNHRLQVFDTELRFIKCFGKEGNKSGRFDWPDDLDFDNKGDIYVTESQNNRVQVVRQNGKSVQTFGKEGVGPGEFSNVNCIHISGDYIYVTDFATNSVNVFQTPGKFLTRFGSDVLHGPQGVVVDKDGFVYVSDAYNHRIVIF